MLRRVIAIDLFYIFVWYLLSKSLFDFMVEYTDTVSSIQWISGIFAIKNARKWFYASPMKIIKYEMRKYKTRRIS